MSKAWNITGWFAATAWCRVVVDLFYIDPSDDTRATLIDFKTGSVKEDNEEQLELYALAVLMRYKKLQGVTVELWYTDHGIILPLPRREYDRKQVTLLKKKWSTRVRPMLNDARFPMKPGFYCRWCHFRKENDGPCEY